MIDCLSITLSPAHQALSWAPALLLLSALGCHSSPNRAGLLPAEFRAKPIESDHRIDLSQVASPGTSASMLAPGDLLEIAVTTGRQNEKVSPVMARVNDDGTVDVPIIGPGTCCGDGNRRCQPQYH